MVYERVKKNTSSWNPAFHQEKSESLFKPRPFSIQPEADTEESETQEIPAYSRADRDAISAKLLKTMGANVQTQAETELQKSESESEELDSDEISNETEMLQRTSESGESGDEDDDSPNGGNIQRLCDKCESQLHGQPMEDEKSDSDVSPIMGAIQRQEEPSESEDSKISPLAGAIERQADDDEFALKAETVQRQAEDDELASSPEAVQRQAEDDELASSPEAVQRQAEDDDDELSSEAVQRQAEDDELASSPEAVQRQAEDDDDELSSEAVQRQAEEDDDDELSPEAVQRQAEDDDDELSPEAVQRQAEEDDDDELSPEAVQRQAEDDDDELSPEAVQRQAEEEDELSAPAEPVQRLGVDAVVPKPKVNLQPSSAGSQLPQPVQQKMEAAFATDFSDVRIHQGPQAKSIKALAYTQGNHIHFAPGKYDPNSQAGQKLLGHELTHVVQQRAGRVPVPQGKGTPINADPALEAEADELGAKAARGEQVTVAGASSSLQRKSANTAPIQRWPSFSQLANKVKQGFNAAKNQVKHSFNTVKNTVKSGFNAAKNQVKQVKRAYNTVKNKVKQGFNTVKNKVKQGFKTVKRGFSAVKNQVKRSFNTVKNTVKRGFNAVKNKLKRAYSTVKNTVKQGFNTVKRRLNTLKNQVKHGYNAAKHQIKRTYNTVKNTAKQGLNTVKRTYNTVKNTAKQGLNTVKNTAKQSFNTVKTGFNTVKNTVKSGYKTVKSGFNTVKDSLKNVNWRDAGHTALDIAGFIPVVGAVADVANAAWYLAEGDYTNAALSAVSALPGVGDAIGAVGKGGKAALKLAKGNKLLSQGSKFLPNAGKVLDTVGGLANKVPGSLKSLPNKLADRLNSLPIPNKLKSGFTKAMKAADYVGVGSNLAAAGDYWAKGDYVNAALSVVSAVPGGRQLGKGLFKAAKNNKLLNKVSGLTNKLPTPFKSLLGKGKGGFNTSKNKFKPGNGKPNLGETVPNRVAETETAGGVKPNRDLPMTAKEKEVLHNTASKRGNELTPHELKAEREVARRAERKPSNDGEHVEQIDLPNGHELKKRQDGMWCRFSPKPGDCGSQHNPDQPTEAQTPNGGPEESAIREAINAIGDQPNRHMREAGQSLRNEGVRELEKLQVEIPQQQRQRGAGKQNNPIVIFNREGHFSAQADVASGERRPWTNEYFAFGQHSPGDKSVRETQTGSQLPGSIHVAQGGKYEQLMAELTKLEQETGLTPTDVVQAMQMLVQTGRVPRALAKHPQYEAKVKAITRLMLNVEPGRGLPATVTLPINFELMKKGIITPREAFVSLNTMSPQRIAKPAHEADRVLGFPREGQYKQKASDEQVQELLRTEREWVVRHLLSYTKGEQPLIKNEQDLKHVLENLPDFLKAEAKKFFTPER
jgi:hypothetical protein